MTGARDIWAVIPVKRLEHAKQRLALVYGPATRRALVLAMLADVLEVLHRVEGARVAVATADPCVAALAGQKGAAVFADDADCGYAEAATAVGQRLARAGAQGMLVLPGDIPGVTPGEVAQVLHYDRHPGVAIVPCRSDAGTNAVLLCPPDAIPLAFGPDSFRRHCEAARRAGIEPRLLRLPGIGLDLDEPEDVAAFLRRATATHTHRALTGGAGMGYVVGGRC